MPELPDLAVFAQNLEARLQGRTVRSIECDPATKLNTSSAQLRDALCNRSIASIRRAGKEMAFVFSNQATLLVHLMLKGEFTITADPSTVNNRILILGLENESLVISDYKKLVTLKLNPPTSSVPDALEVDSAYLREKVSETRRCGSRSF